MSDFKRLERRFPLFFVRLVGGDYWLLLHAGEAVFRKYFQASIALLMVLILSIGSVFYGTDLLFHIWQAELLLALFISGLFGCIYIFLLTTLSKLTRERKLMNVSNCVRIGFLIFMAFLISKPIEVFVFSAKLDRKVEDHRAGLYQNYERRLDQKIEADKIELEKKIKLLETRLSLYSFPAFAQELETLKNTLQQMHADKKADLLLASRRITQSDFLLFRIQEVVREPLAWLVCVVITILFFLPGYLIYSIPVDDVYYDKKAELEQRIVLEEYRRFVTQYRQLFKEKWGVETEFYTCFEDPPFNTVRIKKQEGLSNADFIARYLG